MEKADLKKGYRHPCSGFPARPGFCAGLGKITPSCGHPRLETYAEGLAAQVMHIGPFSEEGPNIQKLHDLIRASGGAFDGHVQKHHEIYLSDFRKVAPEKMKTVLRQPFNP